MVLFIQDGSELIYNTHRCMPGLVLLPMPLDKVYVSHIFGSRVDTKSYPLVIGIAKQTAWTRPEHSNDKKNKEQEEKESQVWLQFG